MLKIGLITSALEDPVELWDTFKRETLEAARWCVGGRPRSWDGFASAEMLDSIEKIHAARRIMGARTSTRLCLVGLELF